MTNRIYFSIPAFLILILMTSCGSEPAETLSFLEAPTGSHSSEPNLHKTDDGTVYLSWIETHTDNSSSLLFSILKDNEWATPKTIATGKEWFINWADFPSITSFGSNSLAAHFLDKSADDTYAYNVKLTLSNDNGNTWKEAFIPHNDNTNTEHGFVSKVALKDDAFLAVWLDGRQMAYAENDSTIVKEMTLRSAIINTKGEILNGDLLDHRVCDCCQTDAAMTDEGPIIVYRDRSEDEIRDIYYVRQVNGHWTTPKPVFNDLWEISGCPVNGPAIASLNHTVATVWFTMANNEPKVKVAFSNDNGNTFNDPVTIGVDPLGRVDIEILDEGSALVCWMDLIDGNTVIQLQKVNSNGSLGETLTVTGASESRSSGFPRMVIKDNLAYLAWTSVGEDQLSIKTVVVNTSNLE